MSFITSAISFIATFMLISSYINLDKNNIFIKTNAAATNSDTQIDKQSCTNCVLVTSTPNINKLGTPILNIVLYNKNTKIIKEFKGVSGRWYTQLLDRNIAGNETPLPNGEYKIESPTKGLIVETGGVFLPITPLFKTNRSELGIHIDPSYELNNGEDGTSGCIAFKTIEEYNEFIELIKLNNITLLKVNIN